VRERAGVDTESRHIVWLTRDAEEGVEDVGHVAWLVGDTALLEILSRKGAEGIS
jgi:hypothetical protein